MVEWDTHTDNVRRGLDRMVQLDQAIERTASSVGGDTLILFTADHSFDFRVRGGRSDAAAARWPRPGREPRRRWRAGPTSRTRAVRMDNSHTGEEVLVAAQGPGANRVKGYLANTDLFGIMMDALGLKAN